ncbi:unnamed protein product [Nezara viridula]|uniref:Uncharacterized protein n=1 Tax=Nezara viridula TaxID=85310 RepID=A0A9P0H1V0_NEZVI|nr:unnamed protein product [Nezara viridula]
MTTALAATEEVERIESKIGITIPNYVSDQGHLKITPKHPNKTAICQSLGSISQPSFQRTRQSSAERTHRSGCKTGSRYSLSGTEGSLLKTP